MFTLKKARIIDVTCSGKSPYIVYVKVLLVKDKDIFWVQKYNI